MLATFKKGHPLVKSLANKVHLLPGGHARMFGKQLLETERWLGGGIARNSRLRLRHLGRRRREEHLLDLRDVRLVQPAALIKPAGGAGNDQEIERQGEDQHVPEPLHGASSACARLVW